MNPTAESQSPERLHYAHNAAPWLAACSDVGMRHSTNQDAVCLALTPGSERTAIIAVSDGVSSAYGAEAASQVASQTFCQELINQTALGSPGEAFAKAFRAANDAVLAASGDQPPSACTLIGALVSPYGIVVGNVGDSRAYWISDNHEAQQLSVDDSLAQARIMLGMSRAEAENSRQAHSITKWLGRNAVDVMPSLMTYRPETAGWLLVCSDGLWNYTSEPANLADLVLGLAEQHHLAADLAGALVAWANAQGGRDNITVALARFDRR